MSESDAEPPTDADALGSAEVPGSAEVAGAVEPSVATEDGALDAREIAARAAPATVRRSPRFGRFVLVGVLAGAVLAALAAVFGPEGEILGRGTIFLLLFLAFGLVGAVVGSVTAVLVDRAGTSRPPADPGSGPAAPARAGTRRSGRE